VQRHKYRRLKTSNKCIHRNKAKCRKLEWNLVEGGFCLTFRCIDAHPFIMELTHLSLGQYAYRDLNTYIYIAKYIYILFECRHGIRSEGKVK